MNNFIKVDDYKEKEKEEFSVIEVYPFLNYGITKDCIKQDKKSLFDFSLDQKWGQVVIHTRSVMAQLEIYGYFIGKGFDDTNLVEGNVRGMITPTRETGNNHNQPIDREYFTINSNITQYLLSDSTVGVRVSFNIDRLPEFKKVLRELRDKLQYRNRYKEGDHFIIK